MLKLLHARLMGAPLPFYGALLATGSPSGSISGVNQTPVAPPVPAPGEQGITPGNLTASAGIGSNLPLTDAATILVPAGPQPYSLFSVVLGGNRTMALPKGLQPGQRIGFLLTQDGTGSRTVTWTTGYVFPAATAPTLTTTASRTDYVEFTAIGTAAAILAGTVPAYYAAGNQVSLIMTNLRQDFIVP